MKAIIFDWDGTIIKSKKANFHAFKKLHDELNLNSVFTMKEFVEWYSPNWYMIYEKMGIPEEEWPCMHAFRRVWSQFLVWLRRRVADETSSVRITSSTDHLSYPLHTHGSRVGWRS